LETKREAVVRSPEKPRRLSYVEKREYEQIEIRIAEAEERLRKAQREMQNPDASHDAAVVRARYNEMQEAQAVVDQLFERWAELESKVAG
jgi:ATP-binding cassette subfamily F protein uup